MKSLQRLRVVSVAAASLLVLLATVCGSQTPEKEFEDFDHSNFDDRSTNIDNEWWPLQPGTQFVYEGFTVEDGKSVPHRVVFTTSLEGSNVELADELTKLIVAQRAFQSNTRIITAADELLEELNRI